MGVARIRITTSERDMVATAQAIAGPAVGIGELQAALAAAKVVHGIDAAAVQAFAGRLADPTFCGSAVLARGEPPTPGADGRIDMSYPPEVLPGETRADGSIDYRERHLLVPVREATELGRIVPPAPGRAGCDVHGTTLPSRPGKPHQVRTGPGTRIVEDRIVATRSGVLVQHARALDVVPLYTHAADVDYASGSLHSEGSLAVRGDVHEGFTAVAAGDVQVDGSVLGGHVRAGGSVRIAQGVLGTTASVHAHGDLSCRHATAAELSALGNVHLHDQAAHCRIRGESLEARTGHGAVLGGDVAVRTRITLRVAGTAAGCATHLAVGDVTADAAAAVRATNPEAKVAERARQRGSGDDRPTGKALRSGLRSADTDLEERLRLRLRQRQLLENATVEVLDTLHVGVRVTFGEKSWVCDATRHHVRLRWSPEDEAIREETTT